MSGLMKRSEWEKVAKNPQPTEVRGCPWFNDPERDLYLHEGVPGDSCFVVGRVRDDEDNDYGFLVHNGAMMTGDGGGVVVAMVSLADRTGGRYFHEEKNFPASDCTFAADRFDIETPISHLVGSSKAFELFGELPENAGSISLHIKNHGPVMENCGTGLFPCVNDKVVFNHYGLPHLSAEGTLELDGRSIAVKGDAWLDRQWGARGNLPMAMMQHGVQTKWMNLNLSNGYKVSLWDIVSDGAPENSWATVLSPDGVVTIAPMEPLVDYEDDFWESPETGNRYPTSYMVEIPSLDASIKVKVFENLPGQEAVSAVGYNRYEAHSDCEGTFMGEPVTGFCCVELVGNFGQPLDALASPEAGAGVSAADDDDAPGALGLSVEGTFEGTLKTPMGEQKIFFEQHVNGDSLTGNVTAMKRTVPIANGHATATGFAFDFKLKAPIGSVEATVNAKVEGDVMTGVVKTPMGEIPFTAERTSQW